MYEKRMFYGIFTPKFHIRYYDLLANAAQSSRIDLQKDSCTVYGLPLLLKIVTRSKLTAKIQHFIRTILISEYLY